MYNCDVSTKNKERGMNHQRGPFFPTLVGAGMSLLSITFTHCPWLPSDDARNVGHRWNGLSKMNPGTVASNDNSRSCKISRSQH